MRAISSIPKLHAMVIREPGDNLLDEFRLLTSNSTSSLKVKGEMHPAILSHLLVQLLGYRICGNTSAIQLSQLFNSFGVPDWN